MGAEVANDALEFTLGIAPSGLEFCFDRRGFLNDDFDEDAFILDRLKMGISLHTLHDSLLQYFNILKNSLVELINRDYADFVNLSTNLVGLDKIIKNLEEPLIDVRERVSTALSEIQEAKREFEFNLEERKKLRDKKELINSLITVATCTSRLERWLSPATPSSEDFNLQFKNGSLENEPPEEQQIDRVAQEYTKLQHFVKKSVNHPFVEELKPRIQQITTNLQGQLEGRLCSGLDLCHIAQASGQLHSPASKKASAILRQVLSTYISIDKLSSAVALYRSHCLHSQLSKIFSPCPELSSTGADIGAAASTLQRMFKETITLLDSELSLFQTLVFKRLHKSYEPLSEFDVIVDAFFPETVDILFSQLPDIFSAGNPDRFHKLYKIGLEFLNLVEARADSTKQVLKLRKHSSYASFLSKWSLSVYFQLRYQECNEAVTECTKTFFKMAEVGPHTSYALALTATITQQIERCWSDGVYLDSLRHRFWKLSLQLVNVYAYLLHKTAVDQAPATLENSGTSSIELILLVFFDGSIFLKWIEEGGLVNLVLPTLQNQDTDPLPDWLTQCVEDTVVRIKKSLNAVKENIFRSFEENVQALTKQVQELPRQYRRTNREWPSTPSAFMPRIARQLQDLAHILQDNILIKPQVEASPALRALFTELFEQMVLQTTNMYFTQTSELIESVRKVEDSLRRLRVARAVGGAQQAGGAGKTDDDKIRHQVRLDTQEYIAQLKTLTLLSETALKSNLDVFATPETDPTAVP
nr:oligomeric Golgi complex subunit 2 [Hymenolepis microstoma]